jgi:hypothetical protein
MTLYQPPCLVPRSSRYSRKATLWNHFLSTLAASGIGLCRELGNLMVDNYGLDVDFFKITLRATDVNRMT